MPGRLAAYEEALVPHCDVRRSLRRGSEYQDMDVPVVSRLVAYGGALVPHDDVRRSLRRGSESRDMDVPVVS